jgi:hypothetical protein
MGTNIHDASHQWASRPVDERFWTAQELYERAKAHRDGSREVNTPWESMQIVNEQGNPSIATPDGNVAKLTNWAYNQLCARIGAPAGYLAERVTPDTAVQCLKEGYGTFLAKRTDRSGDANLLLRQNGSLTVRSVNTESYNRSWNAEVCERVVLPLVVDGFAAPPAYAIPNDPRAREATAEDCLLATSVKPGDMISPAGLYCGERDMFVMLARRDAEDIGGDGMSQGVIISNSEVGARSLRCVRYLYQFTCGNHIIWDATDITEVSLRHVGMDNLIDRFEISLAVHDGTALAQASAMVRRAKSKEIAATRKEVLDAVYKFAKGHNLMALNQKRLAAAYDVAEAHTDRYGSPRAVWGIVSGLTHESQSLPNADARHMVDSQAGALLGMAT